MRSQIKAITFILITLAICACQGGPKLTEVPATDQPEALAFDPGVPAEFKPGDSLRLAGKGTAESEPFTLSQDSLLRVSWDQTEGQTFMLVVQSTHTESDRVQFTLQTAPGAGSGDWIFKAGEYVVVIQGESSSWKLTIDFVDFMAAPDFDS